MRSERVRYFSECETNVVVVVIAKPARAVALLLGDHDSSHASTDSLEGDSIVLPDLVDPSLSWSARTTFPLVLGWSTKRQVDVAVAKCGLRRAQFAWESLTYLL